MGANPRWLRFEDTRRHYYEPATAIIRDPLLPVKLEVYSARLAAHLRECRPHQPLRRIVFVVHVMHRVGGVISIVQLANDLIHLGVDVKVVVLNPDGYVNDLGLETEPIFFANHRDFLEHFPEAEIVIGTLWSTMYFVMHLFLTRGGFLPAYFIQDYEPNFYPDSDSVMRAHVARTYAMTPYLFAKTRWIREQVARHGANVTLVPPALDLDVFYPCETSRAQSPVVLAMIRPSTARRDPDTTLGVLAELHRRRPEVSIHLFGSDEATLTALQPGFPYINHGRVPNASLVEIYSHATLYLECSAFHGFGRTVAEALACGTPCVVTASGGVGDFCVDGDNCLIRPVGDVNGLTAALERFLDDKALYMRARTRSRQSVRQFDRGHSAAETLRYLETVWREKDTMPFPPPITGAKLGPKDDTEANSWANEA